jgi:hypothetical protein
MGAAIQEATKMAGGDWDLKGPDFDTALLGAVTGSIIDADRLVRAEWRNGFPNWILYRTVLCGDSLYLARLRQWAVAFAIAHCMDGGVKRDVYSDELACVAAWDALHMLLFPAGGVNGQIQPYRDTAQTLGVHHSTYKRLRSHLYASMKGSLDEYWIQLGAAYRHVILYERRNS